VRKEFQRFLSRKGAQDEQKTDDIGADSRNGASWLRWRRSAATKPFKLKGDTPITCTIDGKLWTGTAHYIIQGKLDFNGGPAKLHIRFGVDGEAQDKDCKIRGAFNEKFDVDKGGEFTGSFVKTFTYIPAGEGASFKVDLTVNVTGDINDPETIGVTLRYQR